MQAFLALTVRFLHPLFHGRRDQEEPEWPPSPLRVFQALVCASATRWNERMRLESAVPALRWLERQPAPSIIAAAGERARFKYRLYVPDNVADKVAASWSHGGTLSIAGYRVEKDVCPTHLPRDDGAVHYLWPISDSDPEFEIIKDVLTASARSITHLGWGIDMVAANASVISEAEADALTGERWRPSDNASATRLRTPIEGTLDALIEQHHAFLHRLGPEGFHPVPPLTKFKPVRYGRETDPPHRPSAAFSLLRLDGSGFRAFNTTRRLKAVAGMLRFAAKESARRAGWADDLIYSLVLGHAEQPGEPHKPVSGSRLAYLPLPSIQFRGEGKAEVVTVIRRAILMQFGGGSHQAFQDLMRLLGSAVLIPRPAGDEDPGTKPFAFEIEWDAPKLRNPHEPIALLSRLPDSDKNVQRYTRFASRWATVTPLVLPGYDDPRHYRRRLGVNGLHADEKKRLLEKLNERIESLIRSAIVHAGYSQELARFAELEWRGAGFWPGVDLASRYEIPIKLRKFPRLHVRITWRDASGKELRLPGPICLGGGRYFGLGLFAAQ